MNAGRCYAKLGDVGRAISCTEESEAISKESNDLNQLAGAYVNYGLIEFRCLDLEKAFAWFEKGIRAAMASGVEETLASCYYEYGMALVESTANLRLAKKLLNKASTLFRNLGNMETASRAEKLLAAA